MIVTFLCYEGRMEKNATSPGEPSKRVNAPEHATTTFLNSIGNAWMIGTIPFVALESFSKIKGTPISIGGKSIERPLHIGSAAFTLASIGVGAVLGAREAKQLQGYRQALTQELADLHTQVAESDTKIAELTRAVQAKEQGTEKTR